MTSRKAIRPRWSVGSTRTNTYLIAGPTQEQAQGREVSVFPNPYRGESGFDGHSTDGSINPRERVLWFVQFAEAGADSHLHTGR